jgi:GntR family transcriptional regulator / MocR family aminotransferase
VVTTLEQEAADLLALVPSAAGLHVCARVRDPDRLDIGRAVTAAAARGVGVVRLADYCYQPPDPDGLVLGYGMISAERVRPGLRRLIDCLRDATR